MDSRRTIVAVVLAAGIGLAAPSMAAEPLDQLSDDVSGSGCASVSPVPNAAADVAAWQSDCDPAGTNTDGSVEIFRAAVGEEPEQLTNGTGCSSSDPSVSANGNRIAFESNCNLVAENADGNVEIYLWTNGSPDVLTQLTHSTSCDNLAPSISATGNFVAFDSTCSINGTSNGGRGSEIYRATTAGVLKQLTVDPNGGACDSTSPTIDNNGTLVAFDSDCDLDAKNEDLATEIYTVNVNNLAVRQRTFADDDSCASLRPSMDSAGSVIAFHGDCNFTGDNEDRSIEIFTVTVEPQPEIDQVTDSNEDNACVSAAPHMAASGSALVFSSFCNINGRNNDNSIETFQVGVGAGAGGILRVTNDDTCSSPAGGISADGTLVTFDSECDPADDNEDGSVEVFRAGACACGAPATRRVAPMVPVASDAQFALRAAVGSAQCAECECDADSSGTISAGDALIILKIAVGHTIALNCPEP